MSIRGVTKGENMRLKKVLDKDNIEMDEDKQKLIKREHSTWVHGSAGSGKTFLLLARIAYLIKSGQATRDEILNLVYDREVARNNVLRYRQLYADDEYVPSFVDLYHVCYQLIQSRDAQEEKESYAICWNMEKMIRTLLRDEFGKDGKQQEVAHIMRQLQDCKHKMLTDSEIAEIEIAGIDFFAFYKAYEKLKRAKKMYDKEDILVETFHILHRDPKTIALFQQRYTYIHIDDVQELSSLAHAVLQMLVSKQAIVFMLADEYQGLNLNHLAYKDAVQMFIHTYGKEHVFALKQTYRNNKSIAQVANAFMFKDTPSAALQTKSEEECEIKFKGFSELKRLYDYALRKVQDETNDIAFLYHDLALAIPLMDTFYTNAIAFYHPGNISAFLQEDIVMDIYNFIALLIDPRNKQAFYEIYPKMGLDISNKVWLEVNDRLRVDKHVDVYQAVLESSFKIAEKKKLSANMEYIRSASLVDTFRMIELIFDKLNYKEYLTEKGISMSNSNIIAMKVLAERYRTPQVFLDRLRVLSEQSFKTEGRIHIRSISSSKGLEYHSVCLLDCMASTFPTQSCNAEEHQKERRLFYVGITRAKHQLELFTAKRCFSTRLEISPFLYEIHKNEKIIKKEKAMRRATLQTNKLGETSIRRGLKIVHNVLGKGSVLKVADGMMQVRFANETKTLNIRLCLQNDLIHGA